MLIYKHTCIITGKSYVGQTKYSLNYRWLNHIKDAIINNSTCHFHQAIRKHGIECWTHEVLEEGFTSQLFLDASEIYWIDKLDTFKNGYNETSGGKGGKKSEITKRKISIANKGKKRTQEQKDKISYTTKIAMGNEQTRKKCGKAQSGKHLSKEHKQKVSKANLGKKRSQETLQRLSLSKKDKNHPNTRVVTQINKQTGEVIATYDMIKEASQKTGINKSNIGSACRGKINTAGGFIWRYVDSPKIIK